MRLSILICALVGLLQVSPLEAEIITVQAGNHDLLANTADQVIEILISGDGKLQGVNFDVQIGNGKTGEVPAITNVDIIGTGLLFSASNTGDNGDGSGIDDGLAGFWSSSTTTQAGETVTPGSPNSILAKVEISTVGFDSGSFELILNDGLDVLTDFAGWEKITGNDLTIFNGTVKVVPEPSSFILFIGLGSLGVAVLKRRRRRVGH